MWKGKETVEKLCRLGPAGDALPGALAGDAGGFLGKLTNGF